MHTKIRRILVAAASTALVFSVGAASAKAIMISGNLVGVFQSSDNPYSSVTNLANGDASFRTGKAVAGSFQSGVEFNGESFSGLTSGDDISIGMFTFYNGITTIGTSSGSAVLDLYLELTDPESTRIPLTTITFGIDATTNTSGNLIPDNYYTSFTQPSDAWIGGELVTFSLSDVPAVTTVAENTWKNAGRLSFTSVAATPVADGGVTALFLVLGLAGILGYRGSLRRSEISEI